MKALSPLHFVCASLSPGADPAPALQDAIAQGTVDWQRVCWLAGVHLVTPSLAGALRRKGLFDRLPAEVRDYLDAMQALNRERNAVFLRELTGAVGHLNRAGIEPLLLKGSIALLPDQYPGSCDRVIGDLDLLVPESAVEAAFAALEGSGYRPVLSETESAEDQRRHHDFGFTHPDHPVMVEIHRRLLHDKRDDARLRAGLAEQRATLPGTGLAVRVPDLETRLLHNFLHTQIQDMNHALLCLSHRQLLEFAWLRHGRPWDWPRLAGRVGPSRQRAFAAYLLAAERWHGQPFPNGLRIPAGARLWAGLTDWAQSGEGRWRRLLPLYRIPRKHLPRLPGLLGKLRRPSWFALKYRALRRGRPL